MKLWVNGEERAVEAVADVAGLVAALGLDPRKVAVERTLEIVPRSTYAAGPRSPRAIVLKSCILAGGG